MSRKRIRKLYREEVEPIPDGFEIHHIIPIYEGGTDELSNLIALSREDHRKIHYERYLKKGDIRDLMASKIGITDSEIQNERCKLGGKKRC
jgi:hypothetical protein